MKKKNHLGVPTRSQKYSIYDIHEYTIDVKTSMRHKLLHYINCEIRIFLAYVTH